MVDLNRVREHIISKLRKGLAASLTYHSLDHTLDVETQCMIIAREEGVTNEQELLELQIATLYHDSGFLYAYEKHEQESCELVKRELPGFGLNEKVIENICKIILATRVPQAPKNLSERIICDADLDYLGRDDYFIINEKLHKEFLTYKIIPNEEVWESSRIAFLQSHSYFTKYSQQRRTQKKLEHLDYLLSIQ